MKGPRTKENCKKYCNMHFKQKAYNFICLDMSTFLQNKSAELLRTLTSLYNFYLSEGKSWTKIFPQYMKSITRSWISRTNKRAVGSTVFVIASRAISCCRLLTARYFYLRARWNFQWNLENSHENVSTLEARL